jgi:hypothetical protein
VKLVDDLLCDGNNHEPHEQHIRTSLRARGIFERLLFFLFRLSIIALTKENVVLVAPDKGLFSVFQNDSAVARTASRRKLLITQNNSSSSTLLLLLQLVLAS